MKPPILFIRCRDSGNILKPVRPYGTISIVNTLLSSQVKFGAGAGSDANTKYINIDSFDAAVVNSWQKFTFQMALKATWNCANGAPASGWYGFFDWRLGDSSKVLLLNPGPSGTDLAYLTGGAWTEVFLNNFSWTAGDIVDFSLVVDKDGIGGGANKIQLFINGNSVFTSTTTPPALTGSGSLKILTLTAGAHAGAYFDYVKIFDYAVTSYVRDRERFGMNDQISMM